MNSIFYPFIWKNKTALNVNSVCLHKRLFYHNLASDHKADMKSFSLEKYYKSESLSQFIQWFVGFSDAESGFSIQPVFNSNNEIKKITWLYKIELHKDDLNVLEYIRNTLGIGKVNVYKNKSVYTITNKEGICRLISIFDHFPLNSSKYLDFVNFKKAFELYSDNSLNKKELADRIIELKDSMNTKRKNIILPVEHNITITKSWLLGFIALTFFLIYDLTSQIRRLKKKLSYK